MMSESAPGRMPGDQMSSRNAIVSSKAALRNVKRFVTGDLAFRWWREGYDAIANAGAEAAERPRLTRLLGKPALVVEGEDAARRFYDQALIAREGAVPAPLSRLLFGKGAVHGLDGDAHVVRKQFFVEVLCDSEVARLTDLVDRSLRQRMCAWVDRGPIAVFDELVLAYGAAVFEWAGIVLDEEDQPQRSRDLAAIVDGFGGAGRAYPRAWSARLRTDRWAAGLVRQTRSRPWPTGFCSPLESVSFYEEDGAPLSAAVAGVELINLLRPTVAVAWLGSFAVLALSEHPELLRRLAAEGADSERKAFANEVRRLTPFVPALAGRFRRDYVWQGNKLKRGDRVIFDVPGTNTDPRAWENAEVFNPERFLGSEPSKFAFVPQGGGDVENGHRCPGEGVVEGLLTATLQAFSAYGVETDPGEPQIDRSRIPTLPEGGPLLRLYRTH